jgi:hypothetical protein
LANNLGLPILTIAESECGSRLDHAGADAPLQYKVNEMPEISAGRESNGIDDAGSQAHVLISADCQAGNSGGREKPKPSENDRPASLSERDTPSSLDIYGARFENIVRADYSKDKRAVQTIDESDRATIQTIDPRTGCHYVSDVYRTPNEAITYQLLPDGTHQQTSFTYTRRELNTTTHEISYQVVDGGRVLPNNCIYTVYPKHVPVLDIDNISGICVRGLKVDASVRYLDGSGRTDYGVAGSDKAITIFDKPPEHTAIPHADFTPRRIHLAVQAHQICAHCDIFARGNICRMRWCRELTGRS